MAFFNLSKNSNGQVIGLEGKCPITNQFISFEPLMVAHIVAHVKNGAAIGDWELSDENFHIYADEYFIEEYVERQYNFGHCSKIAMPCGTVFSFFCMSQEHTEIVAESKTGRRFSHLANRVGKVLATDFIKILQLLYSIDWR